MESKQEQHESKKTSLSAGEVHDKNYYPPRRKRGKTTGEEYIEELAMEQDELNAKHLLLLCVDVINFVFLFFFVICRCAGNPDLIRTSPWQLTIMVSVAFGLKVGIMIVEILLMGKAEYILETAAIDISIIDHELKKIKGFLRDAIKKLEYSRR